jgi:hypothetical protein
MPGQVFISYRRHDGAKDARAVFERLRREFGNDRVFMDLEGISPGEDFVEALERQLDGCSVLVALMGRNWAGAGNVDGERRIDDENDFVRIELRAALTRGIKVFPVLIDGASPPKQTELPQDLRPLVRRQAISLDYAKFDDDLARLSRAIRQVLGSDEAPSGSGSGRENQNSTAASLKAPPTPSRHLDSSETRPGSPGYGVAAWVTAIIVTAIATGGGWWSWKSRNLQARPANAAVDAKEDSSSSAPPAGAQVPVANASAAPPVGALAQALGGPNLEYRASHIMTETADQARSLIAQIKSGARFEDLARSHSRDTGSSAQGGALHFVPADGYVPEFSRAMVALKPGQMTEQPVKTQFGYHVIRLDEVRAQRP